MVTIILLCFSLLYSLHFGSFVTKRKLLFFAQSNIQPLLQYYTRFQIDNLPFNRNEVASPFFTIQRQVSHKHSTKRYFILKKISSTKLHFRFPWSVYWNIYTALTCYKMLQSVIFVIDSSWVKKRKQIDHFEPFSVKFCILFQNAGKVCW